MDKKTIIGDASKPIATFTTPSISRRFICGIYELLLLLGVIASTVIFPQILYSMATTQMAAPWVLQGHLIAVLGVYFIWFWRHGGQTLAMKTWKIRLESGIDGGTITLPQGLLRFICSWPSWLFFGAGIFWAWLDREQQFLHDRISGTRLVMVVTPANTLATISEK